MIGDLLSVVISLEVKMEKTPTDLVQHVLLRCAAWGFGSSGVERSFSIGSWAKHVKRDVTPDLAFDEVLAIQFPEQKIDEFLFHKLLLQRVKPKVYPKPQMPVNLTKQTLTRCAHMFSLFNEMVLLLITGMTKLVCETCFPIRLIMMAQREWET